MRKLWLAILLLSVTRSQGQNALYNMIDASEVAGITAAFYASTDDTMRLGMARALINYYSEGNADSAIHYSNATMEIANRRNFPLWKAAAYYSLAYFARLNQNFAGAFQYYSQGEAIANDVSTEQNLPKADCFAANRDPHYARMVLLGNILDDFGGLYAAVGDSSNYHKLENRAIKIAESIDDRTTLSLIYIHLSQHEQDIEKRYQLTHKSLQYARDANFHMYRSMMYSGLGWYWLNKKEYDSASYYFRTSLDNSLRQNSLNGLIGNNGELAILYLRQKQLDSSLYYARNSLDLARHSGNAGNSFMAYARLSNIFLARQEIDSAYFYLRKQNAVRDSLTAVKDDNLVQYQLTAIREQKKLQQLEKDEMERRNLTRMIALGIGLLVLLLIGLILYRNNRQKHKANIVLADTLANLKNTQAQLLQSEKMASLGELTAGIAHEIQNPLNFVTNFSELSNELIEEMNDALQEGDLTAARSIAADVQENLQKINHHGKRADGIVKGMLQHSKSSKGQKEPTDVNALCDEYLRLSYHGLRAKDKSFNATLKTDFDESIGKINLIPQDIGRVIMNLLTNAFYAVNEKAQHATRNTQPETFYEPTVSIRTKKLNDKIEIRVSDNGNGIPAHILDKIFQPFFTTKPTGQGTGLGLSLSYDIISKGHGGELKAESQEGNGSTFIIQLPLKYV